MGASGPTQKQIFTTAAIAAVAAVGLAIIATHMNVWPFSGAADRPTLDESRSFWQIVLSDQLTFGFFRLALVLSFLYLIASIPVLILHNHWVTRLSPIGAGAEEVVQNLDSASENLKREVEVLRNERNELFRMIEVETEPPG